MTRTVLTNNMVAHVWAQQTQPHGRSSNGNSSFDGPSLYSYAAEIARFVPTPDGRSIPLFTDRRWSITTSAHQSRALSAATGYTVPSYTNHAANLAFLVAAYDDQKTKLIRIRDLADWQLKSLPSMVNKISDYARDFGLAVPPIDTTADIVAIKAAHIAREARLNTPKASAARERARTKRQDAIRAAYRECRRDFRTRWDTPDFITAEDQAARTATQATIKADLIAAWRSGLGSNLLRYCDPMPMMLRVCGDTIETSRGASFPASHGKRAFPLIAAARASGQPWQPNGHAIHLGPFTIDRIDPDGTVHAGCHTVPWSEIAACAAASALKSPL